jgi:4-hydroxy-tetrahydrodipicolinate reductase
VINILMTGCNGKMGQVITRLSADFDNIHIAAGISREPEKYKNPYPVYQSLGEVAESIDAVIDFSNPERLSDVLKYCKSKGVALVLATTGLTAEDQASVEAVAERIPIFMSANMSLGINVLIELSKTAASKLGFAFDIEILEKHHNEKKDAPSGTALMIANEVNQHLENSMDFVYDRSKTREKRKSNEIGISAIRGGTIPGEHSIFFAGKDEIVELKHTALSRDIFGIGALRAAQYIAGKQKGIYDMKSMLREMI